MNTVMQKQQNLVIVTMKTTVDKAEANDKNDPVVNILRVLQNDFNCTVLTPPDGEFGAYKNKRWTGMLGMVIRGEADVSLANLGISYDRFKVVEFSQYLDIEAHKILSVVPQSGQSASDVMHAFDHITGKVWVLLAMCIVVTVMFGFIALKVIMKADKSRPTSTLIADNRRQWSSQQVVNLQKTHPAPSAMITQPNRATTSENSSYFNWYNMMRPFRGESLNKPHVDNRDAIENTKRELEYGLLHYLRKLNFILYGQTIGQGTSFTLSLNSARIMFMGFVWSMFFFRNFFTGLIQTDLVIHDSEHLIDNLEDILKKSNVYPIVASGTLVEETFEKGAPNGPYARLWARMQTRVNKTSIPSKRLLGEPVLDMLITGDYVVVRSEPGIMDLGQEMCKKKPGVKIHMSKTNLFDRQHGMVYRKDLALSIRDKINRRLESLVQSGIYGHWLESKFGTIPKCFDHAALPDAVEIPPMQLESAALLFRTLAIADTVAVLLLLIENAIYRGLKKKRQARKRNS